VTLKEVCGLYPSDEENVKMIGEIGEANDSETGNFSEGT
jgi:hypothetical protein